jgi:predicted membrane-bound dolichyl-phosphate-mannose-protein mannosyltransferase
VECMAVISDQAVAGCGCVVIIDIGIGEVLFLFLFVIVICSQQPRGCNCALAAVVNNSIIISMVPYTQRRQHTVL